LTFEECLLPVPGPLRYNDAVTERSGAAESSMGASSISETIGVLASGGLDSSILIGHLLRARRRVQPFYIRTGLVWQAAELPALHRFLAAVATSDGAKGRLAPLVVLEMPLDDLYTGHWSLTGRGVPGADSADEAVFLPGRNALLLVKAVVWCQLHGIGELALAPLGTSPFDDASSGFLAEFQAALNRGSAQPVKLTLPFRESNKRQVMALGGGLPLEWTLSCIAPVSCLSPIAEKHCGRCNKCAERQAAFRDSGLADRTVYAA
jgi:7-cyano-7-deazaguanine synthase